MKSKLAESDIGVFRQSKSTTYSQLDSGKYEKSNAPLNPNTLIFTDKRIEIEYTKQLYLENSTHFAPEFQVVLTYFYIVFSLISAILISFTFIQYYLDIYTRTEFLIHLIFLLTFSLLLFSLLYLIWKYKHLLLMNKILFTSLAVLFNTYLILSDNKILQHFITSGYNCSNSLPYSIPFVLLTVLYRNLLMDDFSHYLIIIIHGSVLFLSVNLAFSPVALPSKLFELAIITIFLVYQLIEVHINCIRSRIIFWSRFSEETLFQKDQENDLNTCKDFETETEYMLNICNKIRSDIKFVIRAVIFKDVKLRLKDSLISIQRIKRLIGHGTTSVPMKLENQVKDLEDREFISQNYREVSVSSQGDFQRSSTIVNFMDYKNFGLSHDYGIKELASVLEGVGKNWSFDIWFVHETTGHSISILGNYIISKLGLLSRFKIKPEVMDNYLKSLEFHYRDCPYHNACHGADVLHTLMYFYINSDIQKCLNPIETLSSILAALGHDVSHPGVTSRYLITTRDQIALQYNDLSVLENLHCATIYSLMTQSGQEIFENLNSEDWTCSRRIIIEMVLATDMSKHFEILGKFRTRSANLNDLAYDKFEDKLLIFETALKAADVGHSAKYNDLHQKWSRLVLEEFFRQGDLEKQKNLPVSMYCDRENTNLGKSQAGFLRNICLPLFEVWVKFLGTEGVEKALTELRKNIEYWEVAKKSRRSTLPVSADFVGLEASEARESLGGSNC